MIGSLLSCWGDRYPHKEPYCQMVWITDAETEVEGARGVQLINQSAKLLFKGIPVTIANTCAELIPLALQACQISGGLSYVGRWDFFGKELMVTGYLLCDGHCGLHSFNPHNCPRLIQCLIARRRGVQNTGQKTRLCSQATWIPIQSIAHYYITSNKLLNLPVPQFLRSYNGDNNSTHLVGFGARTEHINHKQLSQSLTNRKLSRMLLFYIYIPPSTYSCYFAFPFSCHASITFPKKPIMTVIRQTFLIAHYIYDT